MAKIRKWQIPACSMLICMFCVVELLAQQPTLNKRSARSATTKTKKTAYVAQKAEYTNDSQKQIVLNHQSDEIQNTQTATEEIIDVDNGLWDGCDPGNCCAICGGGYCSPPLWYTLQGANVMGRSAPRKKVLNSLLIGPLSQADQTATQHFLFDNGFNTKSISYNAAAGYNGTVGRYLGLDSMNRDDFLEFTYWGMNTWHDSVNITGERLIDSTTFSPYPITIGTIISAFPNSFLFPFYPAAEDVGGFNRADLQTYYVDSEMHNWELNLRLRPRGRPDQLVLHPSGRWRRECQPGTYLSYLVGIRYITLGEGMHWHSEGNIQYSETTSTGPLVDHPISGDYDVKTENDLLGFQIGADLMFRRCKWSWGVEAKIGPYVNFARDVQSILTSAPFDPYATVDIDTGRLEAQKQNASLVGEIKFLASYRFRPNLIGHASYEFMWMSGLALGPEQIQLVTNPLAHINTNGSVFLNGVSLGLEWCW
ncbi:MAG: BBP7 family outer membrane beta-barrel protein [Thermoguttaceae bacterium]